MNNNLFDNIGNDAKFYEHQKQMENTVNGIFKVAKHGAIFGMIIWMFSAILGIALTTGIVLVAWHFIAKVW